MRILPMKFQKRPSIFCSRKKWLLFSIAFMFARVTAGGPPSPSSGLLCISECTTCPVLCSPPPSSSLPSKPPPPPSSSLPSKPPPPQQLPKIAPPKSPQVHPPPPSFYYFTSPPMPHAPARAPPPPPPPYDISGGSNQPPSPSYVTVPSTGTLNSTTPYYYIYSSKAISVSHYSPFFLIAVFSLLLVNGQIA